MMLFIIQENALISSVYSQFLNDKHKTFNSSQSEHCLLHMSALCQEQTLIIQRYCGYLGAGKAPAPKKSPKEAA